MQNPTPSPTPRHPTQLSAELPAQLQGGNNISGPANTQFRHELPEQKPQYIPTWTPFSIPTANDSLTSGFPYTSRLQDMRVTPDQWLQFTTEVVNAAKLTFTEDAAAWTTGVTTGTLSSPFLLVFAPMVGYYAGKSVHKKTVVKKVRDKLAVEGPLRTILRQWNEGVFAERGVQLWLEPPNTGTGEVIIDVPANATPQMIAKAAKKQAKRFRFVCFPFDPRNKPLGSDYSPTSPSQQNPGTWSAGQSPASVNAKIGYFPPNGAVEVDAVRPVAELGDMKVKRKPLHSEMFELDSKDVETAPPIPPKDGEDVLKFIVAEENLKFRMGGDDLKHKV